MKKQPVVKRKTKVASPFSKFVRKTCIDRDMTVKDLAKQIGYSSPSPFYKVLNGETPITDKMVTNIARCLNLDNKGTRSLYELAVQAGMKAEVTVVFKNLNNKQKEFAEWMSQTIPGISEQDIARVKKILI